MRKSQHLDAEGWGFFKFYIYITQRLIPRVRSICRVMIASKIVQIEALNAHYYDCILPLLSTNSSSTYYMMNSSIVDHHVHTLDYIHVLLAELVSVKLPEILDALLPLLFACLLLDRYRQPYTPKNSVRPKRTSRTSSGALIFLFLPWTRTASL